MAAMGFAPDDALKALLGAALRGRTRQVETLLVLHPRLPMESAFAAAALADLSALEGWGGSVDEALSNGLTPLTVACSSKVGGEGRAEAVRCLLRMGANPGDGCAFHALDLERYELLQVLIEGGLDLNDPGNARGTTLLHHSTDGCWRLALEVAGLESVREQVRQYGSQIEHLGRGCPVVEHGSDRDQDLLVQVPVDLLGGVGRSPGRLAGQVVLDQGQDPVPHVVGRGQGSFDQRQQAGGISEREAMPVAHALEQTLGIHGAGGRGGVTRGLQAYLTDNAGAGGP
jgi:hypothetical protein